MQTGFQVTVIIVESTRKLNIFWPKTFEHYNLCMLFIIALLIFRKTNRNWYNLNFSVI